MNNKMYRRSISYRDPVAAFQAFADDSVAVLLDHAIGAPRVSTIAVNPSHIIMATQEGVFVDGKKAEGDPFAVLEREWAKRKIPASPDASVAFTGGLIGTYGYGLANSLERLPPPKPDALNLPLMSVGVFDTVAVFDHAAERAWIFSHAPDAEQQAARLATRLDAAPTLPPPLDWASTATWQAELNRRQVESNIQRIIDYIYAGDIFQANYTQRFTAPRPAGLSDFDIYRRLREISPAPCASFMRFPDVTMASASPECFVRLTPAGHLETWPIKGTRPRDGDPKIDASLADELRHSAKDNAENLMIVDLMRNDLGRVAEIGSIRVPSLCALETFSSVHHLVSCVTGQLRAGLGPVDVLRAAFPGGSITGAPKIRAMEIIHELEPAPRGMYCGCMGWIGFDGAMDMGMTIRALTLTRDMVLAQAGGGIVADSDPVAEYEESMIKIAPLLQAVTGRCMPLRKAS